MSVRRRGPWEGWLSLRGQPWVGRNFRQSSGVGWREEPLDRERVIQAAGPPSQMLFSPRCCEERARPRSGPPPPWLAVTLGCLSPLSPRLPLLQGGGQSCWPHRTVGRTKPKQSTRHRAHQGEKLLSQQTRCSGGDNWEQRLLVPRLPVNPKPLQVFAAVEKNKTAEVDHSGDVDSRV